uniref:Ketosynthase family 3 (KS3) domain-containing protein n=1 Tax=Chromera velia CCMP2878 TaxID=1169474 RepID=A0A0G4HWW7_9ALVE|eukprot:Cvel_32860.t1-p1 / transcript=Cvel_32860.t1 / gene=Cvel_32860 / organism=Chromera_velia_CCMP2878 / gene_product=Putative inactive phenolphthiocerol synthesis, putative / transcript_product=Putative inactive phenolphthiocerol synthesis, putative / location=Cvel_scaffold5206:796-2582(-) / protein_length=565 / sequence_SO=supercontig / SO=protein_coding / is_pseudo=false
MEGDREEKTVERQVPHDSKSFQQMPTQSTSSLQMTRALSVPSPRPQLAVCGVACRLPGSSNSAGEFWRTLEAKTDCFSAVPPERWDHASVFSVDADAPGKTYAREAAFIDRVEMFDNSFFAVSAAEARQMDPQQRHMLEVSYEAFVSAGYSRESLRGSTTSVFVGCTNYDWEKRVQQGAGCVLSKIGSLAFTGQSSCLIANRVSRVMDLRGASMTIDTATSSSLVALDVAAREVRGGRSETALVGGVNLMLSPQLFIALCKTRMLAPDCRCKTFDASANGYARGEGVIAIVLESLETARRRNRPVLALVRGTAACHDGTAPSLTAPRRDSQVRLMREALIDAGGVLGRSVAYIEAHGTGTKLGDPIEVGALREVYGEGRDKRSPLVVGALKTNIGHLEGAAGLAGFLKLVLVLQQRRAPANLHFRSLNPHIDIQGFPVLFPTETVPLEPPAAAGGKLIGAVSSFGFGGQNAHAIVEEGDRDAFRSLVAPPAPSLFPESVTFPLPPLRSNSDMVEDGTNTVEAMEKPAVGFLTQKGENWLAGGVVFGFSATERKKADRLLSCLSLR